MFICLGDKEHKYFHNCILNIGDDVWIYDTNDETMNLISVSMLFYYDIQIKNLGFNYFDRCCFFAEYDDVLTLSYYGHNLKWTYTRLTVDGKDFNFHVENGYFYTNDLKCLSMKVLNKYPDKTLVRIEKCWVVGSIVVVDIVLSARTWKYGRFIEGEYSVLFMRCILKINDWDFSIHGFWYKDKCCRAEILKSTDAATKAKLRMMEL